MVVGTQEAWASEPKHLVANALVWSAPSRAAVRDPSRPHAAEQSWEPPQHTPGFCFTFSAWFQLTLWVSKP